MVKVNGNLPIEIESNILSRLPVKTLIRFRSVQKSWYSLVSDPHFNDSHRRRSNNNNNNQDKLLLIKNFNGGGIVVANTCSNVLYTFKGPNPRYDDYIYNVVGSSNGLVCVHGLCYPSSKNNDYSYQMEYISLWNPALKINKMIRHTDMRMSTTDVNLCVGFGFHDKTNDYKVIRFVSDLRSRRVTGVEIYSLNSDSWRSIEVADSPENIKVADSWKWRSFGLNLNMGVYVSDATSIPNFFGAYCWFATTFRNGEPIQGKIISFDIGDEVFKETMLPPVNEIYEMRLFNYKDSLAALEMLCGNGKSLSLCHVWVMKEFNEPKSWTKLCKFDAPCPYKDSRFVGVILETELILMVQKPGSCKEEMCVRDIDNLQINTCFTKDISILAKASYVSSFTESLVLLDT